MTPLEELGLLLRPAGGGLYVVSSGVAAQAELQRRIYGVRGSEEVGQAHLAALARIASARVVILGIPSDVGAGVLRGANFGPAAIRTALLDEEPDWPGRAAAAGIVDAGDVIVVPQLLHDEMLSESQKASSRRALYGDAAPGEASGFPVSPLSIAERALDLVLALNPDVRPVLLGGDHSCAWPAVAAIARARARAGRPAGSWGIVQPDAHTDLLPERLGVKICFGSWSYHANDLVGRGGRLVQVGIRVSRHDRAHWESTLGVRQFWADECRSRPGPVLDEILAHCKAVGMKTVYFSNDIDGTDAAHAEATGTPEPGGLEPDFVVELVRRLGREIGLCGGDVMEVAPPLARTPGGAERTASLAARYVRETIGAIVGSAHEG